MGSTVTPIDISNEQLAYIKQLLREAIAGDYFKEMQDHEIPDDEKLGITQRVIKFLETPKSISGKEIVASQDEFMQQLKENEIKLKQSVVDRGKTVETKPSTTIPLTHEQQKVLVEFMKPYKWVNNPSEFVYYLMGRGAAEKIKVAPSSEGAVCYFIQRLFQEGIIRSSSGRGYVQLAEVLLCANTPVANWRTGRFVKNILDKFHRDKTAKAKIEKDFKRLIASLK